MSGKSRKNKKNVLEDVKLSRHLTGKFSQQTEELIKSHFLKKPEVPVTTEYFKNVIRNGSVFVNVSDENSPSEEVEITNERIFPIRRDSNGVPERISVPVFSVTVFTSGGFGVKFKSLKDNNKVIVL